MGEFTKPVEKLSQSAKEYIDLRTDDLKLRVAKGLSISLNQLLSLTVVLFSASVVLLALAFGFILLLGQLLRSYALGAFIVALLFGILTFVLFKMKDKLFLNTFVKLFVNLFFEEDDEEDAPEVSNPDSIQDIDGKKISTTPKSDVK